MRKTLQQGLLSNVIYLIDGLDIREPGNVVNNICLVMRSCSSESQLRKLKVDLPNYGIHKWIWPSNKSQVQWKRSVC